MNHKDLISIAQLQQALPELISPCTEVVQLALPQALGAVCAQQITSPIGLPMQPVSMMDGYALSSPAYYDTYTIVERVTAGMIPKTVITGNQCCRIFTGAVMPQGADMVIPQEQVERLGQQITLKQTAQRLIGKHIRPANDTLAAGDIIIPAKTQLTSTHLALCASVGIASLPCFSPLRIMLFTTGNECVPLGNPLMMGQIYNSNHTLLINLLKAQGYDQVSYQHLPDDVDATREALSLAAQFNDVIITTGGISVGEEDHVGQCLQQLGQRLVWRVNMKPGKQLTLGQIGKAYLIGLPGNPVAAFTSFMLFGRQILALRQGITPDQAQPAVWRLPIHSAYPARERDMLIPAYRIHQPHQVSVCPVQMHSMADIHALTQASGLIHLPAHHDIQAGQRVNFMPFYDSHNNATYHET